MKNVNFDSLGKDFKWFFILILSVSALVGVYVRMEAFDSVIINTVLIITASKPTINTAKRREE